jgi:Fur family peroxide stress response transcriptional regulator
MTSHIEELLLKHGVKPTAQRAVITEYLIGTDMHPTADEVFQAVTQRLPVALSRATVYNTLNTLVEAGVIKEITIEPGRSRYDAKCGDHHHFVDTETGRVYDVEAEQVPSLKLDLGPNFDVHGYHVTIFGSAKKD